MRLFIAVQLSDSMNKALIGVMHELKKQGVAGSYTPLANLHMTLAFLGETTETDKVKAVMDSVSIESFRLSLEGSGYFGDILWAGVKSGQKMKKYASDLKLAMASNGLPCDMKKMEPHITLVRGVKGKKPSAISMPKADMMVTKISLMKSEQKNGKTVYKEIYAKHIR